jgi:hypothetical protein
MRLSSLLSTCVLLLASTSATAQSVPVSEEAGVRTALEHYLQGHATGDGAHLRRAFHPEARLFWVRDGRLMQRTSEEYIAGFTGPPAADEAQRQRRIVSIDISGSAAVATVELNYPEVRFIDYMSLVKIGDAWMIVNKTFYAEPKPRP